MNGKSLDRSPVLRAGGSLFRSRSFPHGHSEFGWLLFLSGFAPAAARDDFPVPSRAACAGRTRRKATRFDAISDDLPIPRGVEREDTDTYQPTIDHVRGVVQKNRPKRAGYPNRALYLVSVRRGRAATASGRTGLAIGRR